MSHSLLGSSSSSTSLGTDNLCWRTLLHQEVRKPPHPTLQLRRKWENKRAVKLCLPFRTLSQRLLSAVALPVRSDAHAKLVFPRALPLLRTRRRSPLPVRTATRARSPPPFLRPSVFNISPACAQNLSPTFLLWRVTSTDFRLVIKWILTKENDLTIYLGHLSTSV